MDTKNLVLGIMSGTSLDGLDLALCEFNASNGHVEYKILSSETVPYSLDWKNKLNSIKNCTAQKYFEYHAEYGKFIAEQVKKFQNNGGQVAQIIASHGHTVFHQPSLGFSTQLGCGATIAAHTGITTVCDFRSLDVAMGGQGAPLVPIGDKLLFSHFSACLNIGGIANISFDDERHKRIAYDICEANMLLNYLAEKEGLEFDRGGALAKNGHVNHELLKQLNASPYYNLKGAKSLGREWFEKNVLSLFSANNESASNLLATSVEHIASIIAADLNSHQLDNCLVTGGGAWNTFLMEKIQDKTSCKLVLPDATTINFKEALIFAFLGYLRINEHANTLASVTGASSDSCGGAIYFSK